ncbi:MerR family transcriptional regulator [Gorillibacterium timonense]|uniref:MerR family transcriptional regulator n=1 Tax=Gorillibacterium timonense TaxID=1689269 RepID=UPI00071D7768|nr:MerR family transcriptional regulator [Gorillibacterium timonense]
MSLVKITEVTEQFDITSRTLRYYEQMGILASVRLPLEKYRFYDEANLKRLQQIMVLRKMQIPIKDIIKIYENQDMTVLVQIFVQRIDAIDNEIEALSELKSLVNEFLQAMMDNGISHISALPLLYERLEDQILAQSKEKKGAMSRLKEVSDKLAKPLELTLLELPPMRMLSSKRKDSGQSDADGFWNTLASRQIPFGIPGSRDFFEFQTDEDIILMQKVTDTFQNDTDFSDIHMEGGLFAVGAAYVDEDMGDLHQRMIHSFDDNLYYEVDYRHDGRLRQETLVEAVISQDSQRERVQLYLPIKRRMLQAEHFEPFRQITGPSAEEIVAANPALHEYSVDFHKITPIYDPHYRVLENGEAEFIAWITPRMLSTNIAVKIPFRVEIEFLAESQSEAYQYGADEGSLWFSHGSHTYTMNAQNNADPHFSKHAIKFNQPMIGNTYLYPQIGNFQHDQYNKLTWIIGEKHFAVILNGDVRFCSDNMPYMALDLHWQKPQTLFLGSNGQGKKRFRSITISQLKTSPKIKLKKGELVMTATKPSNNRLPHLHQLITLHYGENYWFNGCARFLMECLGESDYDYWFFAGLIGENFTQVYSRNHFRGDGPLDYRLSEKGNYEVVEEIFAQCGYASSFVPLKQILNNREMYVQTLMAYIDKGIPVIFNDHGNNPNDRYSWGVLVGYEDYGKTLLYLFGDVAEPDRISVDDLLPADYLADGDHCNGWLFIGEKKKDVSLAELYRKRIETLPELLTFENQNYLFGAKAYRAWADDIENGKFDSIKPEVFDDWAMYKVYVCNLATNSGGSQGFLTKAQELNPDLSFLEEVREQYRQTGHLWNDQHGEDLEALGGGFNITLDTLQDRVKRDRIVAKIREFAVCMDQVQAILNENLAK